MIRKYLTRALVTLLVVATLGATVIGSGMLYWHWRVRSCLATLRKGPVDFEQSLDSLVACEARALHVLIQEIDESRKPEELVSPSILFSFCASSLDRPKSSPTPGHPSLPKINQLDHPNAIEYKCAEIHRWWAQNRHRYPPAWKFWTGEPLRLPPRKLSIVDRRS